MTLDSLEAVDLDDQAELIQQYREACDALDYWKVRRDDLKTHLLNLIGPATQGLIGGATVIRRIHVNATRLDQAGLTKAYPDIVKAFIVPMVYDKLKLPSDKPSSR